MFSVASPSRPPKVIALVTVPKQMNKMADRDWMFSASQKSLAKKGNFRFTSKMRPPQNLQVGDIKVSKHNIVRLVYSSSVFFFPLFLFFYLYSIFTITFQCAEAPLQLGVLHPLHVLCHGECRHSSEVPLIRCTCSSFKNRKQTNKSPQAFS